MRNASYAQIFVMAAIVATLFLPILAGLAWVACALIDASFASLVTFGERLSAPAGLSAWWAIAFLPAYSYAMFMLRGD